METLLTQAWLQAVPSAEVAIASRRYLQQSIPAGPVSRATVVGVLAVDNSLMEIEITGGRLIETLQSRRPVVGGARLDGETWMLASGEPLSEDRLVRVVLPDVIYYGANNFDVQRHDPEPRDTGLDWRQPVFDYLLGLGSTETNPLELALGN